MTFFSRAGFASNDKGYISVGKREETHLFYYFIKSERSPAEDPLLLWFTGGPGCSAFSGLVLEIGPLKFQQKEYNGSLPRLVVKPYSWTKVSNVIFLDAPTGTGFSYSNTREDYFTGDFKASNDNYMFLVKWLDEFPEFRSNKFYVGGDSRSGLPIPFLVQKIANGNKAGYDQPFLNLKRAYSSRFIRALNWVQDLVFPLNLLRKDRVPLS